MSPEAQLGLGSALLFVISTICWGLLPFTGHLFAAMVFLLLVVLAGTRFDRGPVLALAVSSAFVWNFLFIPPRFTLHIENPADGATFALFFVVALAMGHLTTRLRQRESVLQKQNEERENLVSAKHRAELAAEGERLHRTLLDSVSHELKTPITIIRTALDGLGPDNPYAAEIDTATLRLQRIVQNLLEITRVESDAVKPAPDWCEIDDVLDGAIAPIRRDLSRHTLDLDGVDRMPLLKIDSRLLSQALSNVLHNASIHAPPGTAIKVSASLDKHVLEIKVRDCGPGIPPGSEDRLFEKFFRAPGAAAGGTGLGLAISRGLMRVMHGDIVAKSHSGGGAEFSLTVPAQTYDG